MLSKAVAKLKKEMDRNPNHAYIKLLGEFLLDHLHQHPGDSKQILNEGKSISKSLDAMKDEARKKQHNGMAMLTDEEGYAIVLKYFGIEDLKQTKETDFDISLDDYL